MNRRWEDQKERSNQAALRLLISVALTLGRRITRWLLLPFIVGYFLATSSASRNASRQYLRRVTGREQSIAGVARHFYTFASCTLDRIYLLSGRHGSLSIASHRPENVAAVPERGTGSLLMVAHFGSSEALRVIGIDRHKINLSILMDRKHGQMLTDLFERLNPGLALHVIDAAQRGPQLVLALKEALDHGRMVGVMADRARADEPAVAVQFLGGVARLPVGPWILAGALGVPVILGFGVLVGGNRYESHFELLADRIQLPRRDRTAAIQFWAQSYANRLEHYVRLSPYNWFNFYDFWADETPQH